MFLSQFLQASIEYVRFLVDVVRHGERKIRIFPVEPRQHPDVLTDKITYEALIYGIYSSYGGTMIVNLPVDLVGNMRNQTAECLDRLSGFSASASNWVPSVDSKSWREIKRSRIASFVARAFSAVCTSFSSCEFRCANMTYPLITDSSISSKRRIRLECLASYFLGR